MDEVAKIDVRREAEARSLANRKLAFRIHLVVYLLGGLLLWTVSSLGVTAIVLLAWGILLALHHTFFVAGPELRRRWIAEDLAKTARPRAALGGANARELAELSAGVAHEIRSPITAARSLVQQIAEAPDAPERVEYARVALAELERVERSVAHLLRFAREEEVVMRDVRIGDVIDAVLASPAVRERVEALGVTVKRSVDGDGALRGDAEKLERVLGNLVQNALDALEEASPGSRTLDVAAGTNLGGTELWVRVRDTGPGIEPARLGQIFAPFHTGKPNGTGLGLAITRKLVQAHGGTIEASSEPGAGAEFLLTFPRAAS